jgi:hypothetical protein
METEASEVCKIADALKHGPDTGKNEMFYCSSAVPLVLCVDTASRPSVLPCWEKNTADDQEQEQKK